jgi:biopolymer transport protein TolR
MASSGGQYDLNLTPYVDLMSTLIVFLLMTAVWNQIAVLSTDTTSTTSSDTTATTGKPKVNLSLTIMPGYLEMTEDRTSVRIAHVNQEIDRARLSEKLKAWKKKYPERTDVILNSENSVTYKMLISTFDAIVGEEFPDVGVSTQ